ncbi:MAG: type III pantothenate kinase [Planctomycetes bacterium]|nr:type III pantothenate kinase [Planctomycetota bacterium]
MPRTPRDLGRVMTLSVGNTFASAIVWSANGVKLWPARWPCREAALASPERMRSGDVVLAGVVPSILAKQAAALRRNNPGRYRLLRFRKNLPCPIDIAPRPERNVGDDRVAAAIGALALDPRRPWIVIDSGTALTVNAVRPDRGKRAGAFEGWLIVPGELLALHALNAGTAQLPALDAWPASVPPAIGRSTSEAIRAGVRRAQCAAACELAKAQAEQLGPGVRVALTGGGAEALWPVLKRALRAYRPVLVPDLVHRGLFEAWRRAAVAGR